MDAANDNYKPRLMAPKEAAEMTTMSRVLIAMMSREGKFPQPVALGTRRVAYVRAEVEAWIEGKINARDAA